MVGAYRGDIHDGSVDIIQNIRPTLRGDPLVILETLQKVVLDVRHINHVGDILQQALSRLTVHVGREGRSIGPGAAKILNSTTERQLEGAAGKVVLDVGSFVESFRLGVVAPEQIGVRNVIGRLAL